MSDYWAEHATAPDRIVAALRGLLRDSHAADAALVPARVLNLVVVCDAAWRGEVVGRLERMGVYHPSRTILCAVEDGRTQLDARVVIGGENPQNGSVGVLRETIELKLGRGHLSWLDSIVAPVLVPGLPTVLWSPHTHDEAVTSLSSVIDVILIDADDPVHFDGAGAALYRADELRQSRVSVVDLAWLRTISWRERLAGAFAEPTRRDELTRLKRVFLRFEGSSVVSAMLLAGWLASRLGWQPDELGHGPGGALLGTAQRPGSGRVNFEFDPVPQSTRGMAGITLTGLGGFSLALDRAPGGLMVRELRAGRRPQSWQALGASHSEDGILGEGVRQALIRDPTYGPALTAARSFNP